MKRFAVLFAMMLLFVPSVLAQEKELTYDESSFDEVQVWNCFVSKKSAMKVLIPYGFIKDDEKGWDQFNYYECDGTTLIVGFEDAYLGYEDEMKTMMSGWEDVVCNGVPGILNTVNGNGLKGKVLCCITEDRKAYVFILMKQENEWTEEDEAYALRIFSTVQPIEERWP